MNRKTITTCAALLSSACFCAGALADPPEGGNASCLAYEATHVSPPGSASGTFSQFGMPGILAFIDLIVQLSPDFSNRGGVISAFARLHEGSHEACDNAVGVDPDEA